MANPGTGDDWVVLASNTPPGGVPTPPPSPSPHQLRSSPASGAEVAQQNSPRPMVAGASASSCVCDEHDNPQPPSRFSGEPVGAASLLEARLGLAPLASADAEPAPRAASCTRCCAASPPALVACAAPSVPCQLRDVQLGPRRHRFVVLSGTPAHLWCASSSAPVSHAVHSAVREWRRVLLRSHCQPPRGAPILSGHSVGA